MARDDYDDDRPRRGRDRNDDRDDRRERRGRDREDDRDDRRRSREDDRDDRDDRRSGDERRTGSKSIEIKLENVRLSFDSLFKKKKFGEDDPNPKYAATFLMDKRRQRGLIDRCWDAIDDAKFAKWGDKQPSIRDDKLALRDGDDQSYDGYEGQMYVAARSDRRPKVFDRDKTPLTEEDGRIYSGCYVNAVVRFWAQDNKWGKRVNASLEAVQYVKDGEAFGPPPVSDDVFEDLGEDESAEPRRSRDRDRDDDRDRRRDRDDRGRSRGRDRDDYDDDRRGGERDREPPRRGRDQDNDREREPRRARSRDREDDFAEDDRDRDRDRVVDLDDRRRRSRDDDDRRNRPRRDDLV